MEEIKNELRSVLEIKFEDGSKLYVNGHNYMAVRDPYYATRYAPMMINTHNGKREEIGI